MSGNRNGIARVIAQSKLEFRRSAVLYSLFCGKCSRRRSNTNKKAAVLFIPEIPPKGRAGRARFVFIIPNRTGPVVQKALIFCKIYVIHSVLGSFAQPTQAPSCFCPLAG